MKRLLTAAGVGLIGLLFATAAAPKTATSNVKVTLAQPTCTHFTLTPQPTVAKSGQVTIVVSNKGNLAHGPCVGQPVGINNTPETHELVVLKTNLPADKLPLKYGTGPNLGFKIAVEVGRVAPAVVVKPGQTRSVTLTLKPGKYVFICNIFDHYTAGQRAAFTVTG